MRSPKQIEASRINGRLSQGPVTSEGKKNCEGNNLRHGLLAQTVVLEIESETRFQAMLEELIQIHQPYPGAETMLIQVIAVASWRLMRVWGLLKLDADGEIALQDPAIGPPPVRAMYALGDPSPESRRPDVLERYETKFDRQLKSAIARLVHLQSHRGKAPSKPYFPSHFSGHTWKTEEELAQAKQVPSDPSNP